jgi:predicted esterase
MATEGGRAAEAALRIPSASRCFLYHGREDKIVPLSHVEMYAKSFPQAIVRPWMAAIISWVAISRWWRTIT